MAIVIKDYQWRQTDRRIIIYVPLKGRPKNVNLFAMDNYVKVFNNFFLTTQNSQKILNLNNYNIFFPSPFFKVRNFP